MKLRASLGVAVVLAGGFCEFAGCLDEPQRDPGLAKGRAALTATYDWLQFNGDPSHSGNNLKEASITAGNVAQLTRTFQVTLPAIADGAPVLMTAVATTGGVRDLLFVTTKAGHLVALDAHTGAIVWSVQHGPGSCHINNGSSVCYTTSSPAVDPGRQFVYSYGLEGSVHKHAVATGAEITSGGWPVLTSTKPFDEKGSSPLVFATARSGATYLYMTHGGYPGDNGDYQGHITAINLTDATRRTFNAECSNQAVQFVETPGTPDCANRRSAFWARVGVVYDAGADRIYGATGNGGYDPANHGWADSVLSLNPDGTGSNGDPLDSYTPTNFQALDAADADVGSTAPALLAAPAASRLPHLAVQSGKDGKLRLINLDNLSGQGGPGHTGGEVGAIINVPQGGGVLPALPVWQDPANGDAWTFVANSRGLSGIKLVVDASGNPSLVSQWQSATAGTSPLIADGILFNASASSIRALNPRTGAVLWTNTGIGGIHWESPIVANGMVFITDESSHLTAFGLPSGGTGGSGAGGSGVGGTGVGGGGAGGSGVGGSGTGGSGIGGSGVGGVGVGGRGVGGSGVGGGGVGGTGVGGSGIGGSGVGGVGVGGRGVGGSGVGGRGVGGSGAGGSAVPFGVKINFQAAGTPTPSGYLADTGAAFAARGNGFSYGWNIDNSAQARRRQSATSPDVLHDTLIHLQKPANPNAFWELTVPNGTYRVRLVSGDPSFTDSIFRLNAESVLAVSGTPTTAQHWIDNTVTVVVSDGRLSITNASGGRNNKVDFIEVTQ